MMEVRLNPDDLAKARWMLLGIQNGFPKAYARAINKTATSVKQEMVNLVRDEYNYKIAAIRARIAIKSANPSNLAASLRSTGRHVNLTDIAGVNRTTRGLTVDVKKSTGRKLIPRAFLNKAPSGKMIALRRPGKPRGQRATLWARYGDPGSGGKTGSRARLDWFDVVPVEMIYNTRPNWARLQQKSDESLMKNLDHEVDVVLKGIA